jgi:hypothetical protein
MTNSTQSAGVTVGLDRALDIVNAALSAVEAASAG